MSADDESLAAELLDLLRRDEFTFDRRGTSDLYTVGSDDGRGFEFSPTLALPPGLLREYVDGLLAPGGISKSTEEALSLTGIHLAEELGVDHRDGVNFVRDIGFRRGAGGAVELFVDSDPPEPVGQHDDVDLIWTAERPTPPSRSPDDRSGM